MDKKIFRAPNIQTALAGIKEELGPDAMILSTRKVPKSPRDPYAKTMFEVEAAIPSTGDNKPESPLVQDVKALKSDLAQIKDILSVAGFGSGVSSILCNHFESVGVLASLLRCGVSERLAADLVQKAALDLDKTLDTATQMKQLKKSVMGLCLDQFRTKDFFTRHNASGLPQVAAFVGPTGVGKTTTIAKLAACLSFTRKMKVGLVSIDNYRIGAFEQLKAYAGIMGLPCMPAFSRQDLACALDRMKSMDLVLIDTAGHSHYDKEKIDEILELVRNDFQISVHLTLSVTSELINMKEAASAFSVFNPDTYVFTKTDETKRCGKILDQAASYDLPVSLVTNGQKVPEDLIIPDRHELLKIILKKEPKGD
ncbi:flagellar GTP-binding protein [Desulfobacter postgatei]|uniref:Flagellar biosynthesis protein FlhF n=1 Tax=Desulfobacter postgatei 2ac9 TaxID=879212 RepID=I5AZA6_9BACT|nr:flagellar GTP-binding protein [Desulfobacter postgatei]EIM62569.1 flagellar GTP-binding protein [Desulfobacter postgatei 2ac9]